MGDHFCFLLQFHIINDIIIIIISRVLSINTICLLAALKTPPVITGTMSQVVENIIPPVFVSSSFYIFRLWSPPFDFFQPPKPAVILT